jgi:hypothetical protein
MPRMSLSAVCAISELQHMHKCKSRLSCMACAVKTACKALCLSRILTYISTSMSGNMPMLSAASSEFSTSSRTVVYRHLPGCNQADSRSNESAAAANRAIKAIYLQTSTHIVEACDVLVLCKELCRAFLLQFCFHHGAASLTQCHSDPVARFS